MLVIFLYAAVFSTSKVAVSEPSNTGLASSDNRTFRNQLQTMWFGQYARNEDGVHGSSGFEHVFLGEWKHNGKVGGQHHWIRYYKLEQAGQINYHGHLANDGLLCSTIQYEWAGYQKPIGGFLVGTTVEFDFSLFTLCWLTFPNGEDCRFDIDGYPLAVVAWKKDDHPEYIATTYPKILGTRTT